MTGTRPGRRITRARLARCVAVVAVLVGLVLLPCADGMMMTGGHPAHGATSAMAADAGTVMVLADAEVPGSRNTGGLLAACMVFLVAVVATLMGLRPASWRTLVPIVTRAGAPHSRAARPRALSLAELCLLRT